MIKKNGTCYTFENILGNNKELKKSIDFARKISRNNSAVLLVGKTGTGKELFAQSIHNESNFASGSFVPINCAAIPDNLLESILFGTVEGAFTGAKKNLGLLHHANNGTIFLDEINSMNLDSQAKLLRFLQDKTIRSIGDTKERKICCRVISAINKNVDEEIKANKIREDLYYRLSTTTIHIPTLKDRIDDISLLTQFFINKYKNEFKTNIVKLDDNLLSNFMKYNWPGNVRELEHVIESAMNMVDSNDTVLKYNHLSIHLKNKLSSYSTPSPKNEFKINYCPNKDLHEILDEVERQVIVQRLIKNEGNITKTSKDLGIFRQALQYRIKKHKIDELEYLH